METFFQNYDKKAEKWPLQDILDWPEEEHDLPGFLFGFLFWICFLAIICFSFKPSSKWIIHEIKRFFILKFII